MGTHATQRTAPYADWRSLDIESAAWFENITGMFLLTAGDFAPDQADLTASAGITGGATPKVTWVRPRSRLRGYWANIKVPDFAVGRDQANRLAAWNGENTPGNEMGDGGRRIGLQVENVLCSVSTSQGVQTIGADGNLFSAAVKYKGFGAKAQVAEGHAQVGDDAEDAIICANVFLGCDLAAGSFPNALNPAPLTAFPFLTYPEPTFAPDGICRMQTIFDLPNTIRPGSVVEVMFAIAVTNEEGVPLQWQYASYRWLHGPPEFSYPLYRKIKSQGQVFSLASNASFQLRGASSRFGDYFESAQPYFDPGSESP